MNRYIHLAGRILLATIFLLAGLGKLANPDATSGYMQAMGVSGALVWPTLLFEIGAALAIMVGWHTRAVALLLAGFCLVSGAIFHHNFADQVQMILFLKNVSMAGGLLLLVAGGASALSLDTRQGKAA
jgi:putative oxidoreductase